MRLRRWFASLTLYKKAGVSLLAGYLLLAAGGNLLVLASVPVARALGHSGGTSAPGLPGIKHLREVDEGVWAGAQPEKEDFAQLRDAGVSVVVDLRTGSPGDPRLDDPQELAQLGMAYERLPILDGRPPSAEQVERLVEIVESSEGEVFFHCGGGVGRSGALAAGYLAATGKDPSALDYLGVGPPTIEQIAYATAAEPQHLPEVHPAIEILSRYLIDGPRSAANWLLGRL